MQRETIGIGEQNGENNKESSLERNWDDMRVRRQDGVMSKARLRT